jgi:hypothetical protein
VLYLRIAAVALTALFVALLVWLYGVKTTLIWAGAMAAFLLVLWAVTTPLRARQRRAWLEMGLGPDGRPLPEVEDDGSECEVDPEPVDTGERRSDAEPADAGDGRVDDGRPAARP